MWLYISTAIQFLFSKPRSACEVPALVLGCGKQSFLDNKCLPHKEHSVQYMCRHLNKNANTTLQSPAIPVWNNCQQITPFSKNKKDAAAQEILLRSCLQNHLFFGITQENVYTTHMQTDPDPLPLLRAARTWTCSSLEGLRGILSPLVGHTAPRPINMDLWLPWPELTSARWEQEKANVGLCGGRSEQGTATQQSRALLPKELGSNLSFRIKVEMVVNSFRVEIRGTQSQQRRDYGRRSDSTVPQRRKTMRALNTGRVERGLELPSKKPSSIWFLLR